MIRATCDSHHRIERRAALDYDGAVDELGLKLAALAAVLGDPETDRATMAVFELEVGVAAHRVAVIEANRW